MGLRLPYGTEDYGRGINYLRLGLAIGPIGRVANTDSDVSQFHQSDVP